MKKSKKRRAIAPAVLGGCGGLDRLLESLPELWEGLEGPKKIKVLFWDTKKPLRAPAWRYIIFKVVFWGRKSPCGHLHGDTEFLRYQVGTKHVFLKIL